MESEKKLNIFEAAAFLMRNFSLLKAEEYILGCGSTPVAGGGSAIVRVQAMASFHPHRLIIPSDIATRLLITGFDVDDNNQLISTGAIPGEAFLPQIHTHMRFSPVLKDGWVRLSVQNLRSDSFNFFAALIGRSL